MVDKSLRNNNNNKNKKKKIAKVIKPLQYDMWKNRLKTKWKTGIRQ